MTFTGKTAVVTGAASGIGRACATELARRGSRVWLLDRDAAGVDSAARAIGPAATARACDVSSEAEVQQVAREVGAAADADLVLANAGVGVAAPFTATSRADWERVLGVNLWGVLHVVRAFLPGMLARGRGHVVATASLAGLVGAPSMTAYSASKFAVVGMLESLRLEVEHRGVDVTVVCPGFVRTGFASSTRYANEGFRAFLGAPPSWYGSDPSRVARRIVDGVERRERLIVTGIEAVGWWMKRVAPDAAFRLTRHVARRFGVLGEDAS